MKMEKTTQILMRAFLDRLELHRLPMAGGLLNLPLDLPPQIAALCPVDDLGGF